MKTHDVRQIVTVHDEREAARHAKGRITIIDDDQAIRHALSALLEFEGYATTSLDSALLYLDQLEEAASVFPGPHCILLDVKMPELTGLELQSALIELSEMTPLIFMSGGSGASEAVTAFRHGAIDFLIKPFEDQELLLAIQRALEKSREHQLDLEHHQKIGAQLSLLSQREKQIAAMVAKGKLNRDIANELGIAVRTVKLHRMNMMRKLGANNVIELAKLVDQLN